MWKPMILDVECIVCNKSLQKINHDPLDVTRKMGKITSRRSRTPNWSLEEKKYLLELIRERKDVVIVKNNNGPHYSEEKDVAWNEILRELALKFGNKFSGSSTKKVKTQWQNMKRIAREEIALIGPEIEKFTRQTLEVCNILDMIKDGVLKRDDENMNDTVVTDVEIKTERLDEDPNEPSSSELNSSKQQMPAVPGPGTSGASTRLGPSTAKPVPGPNTAKPSPMPILVPGPNTAKPSPMPTPVPGPTTAKPSTMPTPIPGPSTTRPSTILIPVPGPSTARPILATVVQPASSDSSMSDSAEFDMQEPRLSEPKSVSATTMTDEVESEDILLNPFHRQLQAFFRYTSEEKQLKMESLKEERRVVKAMRETAELHKIIAEQKLKHVLWLKKREMAMYSGEPGSGAGKGGGGGGAIREAGGTFGKMEAAREDEYFYKKQKEQLAQLKGHLSKEIAFHQDQIKRHEDAIRRHKEQMSEVKDQ